MTDIHKTKNHGRYFVLDKSSPQSNERLLVDGIAAALGATELTRSARATTRPKSFNAMLKRLTHFWKSRALVVHSPLFFSFFDVLIAKIFRKRVVAFVWDHYPVTIDGRLYNQKFRRRIFDAMENAVQKLTDVTVVPTADFLSVSLLAEAKAFPMWYSLPALAKAPRNRSRPTRIVFVGQINQTRGLEQALSHLDQILTEPVEVHFFSSNRIDDAPFAKLQIFHHGVVAKAEISQKLAEYDFGLISLHPSLDGPGYPSKTYDYLQVALPVLYFGKSLPAFEELVARCGIGQSITKLREFDPVQFLDQIDDFDTRRAAFYNRTVLDAEPLNALLDRELSRL